MSTENDIGTMTAATTNITAMVLTEECSVEETPKARLLFSEIGYEVNVINKNENIDVMRKNCIRKRGKNKVN